MSVISVSLWLARQENANTFVSALSAESARLERIEKSLSALEKSVDHLSGKMVFVPGAGEGPGAIDEWTEFLKQLAAQSSPDVPEFTISAQTATRLENLIRRLEALDQEAFGSLRPGTSMPMPVPPMNFPPFSSAMPASKEHQMPSWFSGLPKNKQAQVEQAFREHAEFIRNEMSYEPNPGPMNPERLRELMELSQDFLVDKLSEILEPNELDSFIQEFRRPKEIAPRSTSP